MIPESQEAPQVGAWKRALAEAVTDPAELLAMLDLPAELAAGARAGAADFPLRVPRGFLARMRKGDPLDPLLLQVLPLARELDEVPGFEADPLAEGEALVGRGLLHKYQGRALFVLTGGCAVHCRYCFRRHFPYAEEQVGARWEEALAHVATDDTIEEILLSGGDPLLLGDDLLARLASRLEEIPHLQRLRLHTRLPVVLPERVDADLLAWLRASRLAPVVVLHINHAREIDGAVGAAVSRLRGTGATVLNQAVLLAGVNDSADAQVELSRALFAAGVLPYYLHLLDRVQGAAHFDVAEGRAKELMAEVSARLPGYLVPRLVREVPGAPAKVAVAIELC